jgi:hypothetical protein
MCECICVSVCMCECVSRRGTGELGQQLHAIHLVDCCGRYEETFKK